MLKNIENERNYKNIKDKQNRKVIFKRKREKNEFIVAVSLGLGPWALYLFQTQYCVIYRVVDY